MRELYEVDQLSLQEIADRLDVTKQAVHLRLTGAGVVMRGRGSPPGERRKRPLKFLERGILEDLYVAQRLSAKAVAARVGCSRYLVLASLRSHGIPRWGGSQRKHPELETLKIGESIVVDRPRPRRFHVYYYNMAKYLGIHLSVKTLDDKNVQLTRVE